MFAFSLQTKQDVDNYLNKGGDINQKNIYGQTILHKFSMSNNEEMIDHLVKKGANIQIIDNFGKLPSHYATDPNIAKKLVNHTMLLNPMITGGNTSMNMLRAKMLFSNMR